MTAALFILLTLILLFTVPIFIGLTGSVAMAFALFSDIDLVIILQRMFAGVNKFALMAIPLFVLAANLMGEGGISKRIIKLTNTLVGDIPGGLGMSVIISSAFFGAISGSAPATVVAIGALLYPALIANKYPEEYASGVISASGSLGIIIPPSVTMIVYGTVTGASVGTLFIAGFGAGLVYALIYIIYTYFYAKKHKEIIRAPKASMKERMDALKDSAWGLGVPFIILGGIYGGVFTPTEAAAVAVVYSLIVALFVYKELNFKTVLNTIYRSALTTVQVMVLLAAASVFAWILASEGITLAIADAVLSVSSNQMVILFLMNIILLVAGMFIDGASFITILGPLFFPIAVNAGVDVIHLGIIMTVNAAIGMFTPPFGLNLFVASSITKQPIFKVAKGAIPFILLSFVILFIVTYFPDVSLWLPRQFYGKW